MAFFPDKPADSDEIRLGAKQIRDNFDGIINDGIVIPKPPLAGDGVPPTTLGQSGERYIDALTGNEYIKVNDVWVLSVDLHELYAAKSELIEAKSDIITIQNDLITLAEEVAGIETGGGAGGGTASGYSCAMFPSNGITNQGSCYWKDSAGHVTVTMRFNSSFGPGISMTSTPAIIMPAGFRPAFDCYAPCYAENAAWNTAALKSGYMYVNTDGTIIVRFPVVAFKGDDFVSGQISYYAGS